jgi:hypothetical protein
LPPDPQFCTSPDSDHVLPPQHILRAGQFQHQRLVQRRQRREVEAVEAFDRRELRLFDAPLDHPALPLEQLQFGQPKQIADMVDAVAGALPGQPVMLAQEGRQLQRLQVVGKQDLGRVRGRAGERVGHDTAPVSRSR